MGRICVTLTAVFVAMASAAIAGPEQVTYPKNFKDDVFFTNYVTINRAEDNTLRVLYATREWLDAVKIDQPLPPDMVLVMEVFAARLGADGKPTVDAEGNFEPLRKLHTWVMQKHKGWGEEYGPNKRAGEWEFAAFTRTGQLERDVDYEPCFACHRDAAETDYVYSLEEIVREGWLME